MMRDLHAVNISTASKYSPSRSYQNESHFMSINFPRKLSTNKFSRDGKFLNIQSNMFWQRNKKLKRRTGKVQKFEARKCGDKIVMHNFRCDRDLGNKSLATVTTSWWKCNSDQHHCLRRVMMKEWWSPCVRWLLCVHRWMCFTWSWLWRWFSFSHVSVCGYL